MRGVILGTGPSLSKVADELREMQAAGKVMLFGMNNSFNDFDLDVWLACDPLWHKHNGKVEIRGDQWHWDWEICEKYGYEYIEGRWLDGLSTDPDYISYGHSSGWQCLNLARHYHAAGKISDEILLCGYDMTYRPGEPRHYFSGVSDVAGEYPEPLRKWSLFDKPDRTGLLYDYRHIAEQCNRGEIPPILNCTPGSAMKWFPFAEIADFR